MIDESHLPLAEQSLVFRLRKRAEIRRANDERKSVREGRPDRVADLLEEAATAIETIEKAHAANNRAMDSWASSADHFVAWVDRHLLPSRAAQRSAEETHSIIMHHPFAQAHGPSTDMSEARPKSSDIRDGNISDHSPEE